MPVPVIDRLLRPTDLLASSVPSPRIKDRAVRPLVTPALRHRRRSLHLHQREIGTRYVQLGVRILVDPADPEDLERVHALQDAI